MSSGNDCKFGEIIEQQADGLPGMLKEGRGDKFIADEGTSGMSELTILLDDKIIARCRQLADEYGWAIDGIVGILVYQALEEGDFSIFEEATRKRT